jgi:hypothetical protein
MHMSRAARRGRSAVTLVLITITATLAPAAFAQAHDKTWSVTLSPATSVASPAQTFTATAKNLARTQTLGSFELTVPAGSGFQVVSARVLSGAASGATTTVTATTVRVEGAKIAPGRTLILEIVVNTTAGAGSWTWTAGAKQANKFNGPNNDFVLVSGAIATSITPAIETVTTQCLEGVDCEAQLTITVDGFTLDFLAQALAQAGTDAGVLRIRAPSPKQLDCAGLDEEAPVTGVIDGPVNRQKLVTYEIDPPGDFTVAPPGVCYAGPDWMPVGDRAGEPYVFEGVTLYPRILPDCVDGDDDDYSGYASWSFDDGDSYGDDDKPLDPRPCVLDAVLTPAGTWQFLIRVPAGTIDPMYRG